MTDSQGKSSRAPYTKILMAILFLLLIAGGAFWYWNEFMRGVLTSNDARLAGQLLDIAPLTSGTLLQVYAEEGDRINKDQLLFTLDQKNHEIALAKAEAAVDTAEAGLAIAEAHFEKYLNGVRVEEIRIAEAGIKKAEAAEKFAKGEWDRIKALHNEGVITNTQQEKARISWETASYVREDAQSRLNLLIKGSREEDLKAAAATITMRKAQLTGAKTEVKRTNINLAHTEIRAPFDGIVVRCWQDPGTMIATGRPVLTMMNPSSLHITANLEEKYLNKIALGNEVDISLDAYPDIRMTGRIEKILPVANSQFSLLPSGGSSGAFIKVAQRFNIRISIENLPDLLLGPGLSAEIRIKINQTSTIRKSILAHE